MEEVERCAGDPAMNNRGAFHHFNYKADIGAARVHKSEYVTERWRSRSKKKIGDTIPKRLLCVWMV